ncbi:hypothetical protein V6Z12_D08G234700 [Gossypium hirsutum]
MGPARAGFACSCNSIVQMKLTILLGYCVVEIGRCHLQNVKVARFSFQHMMSKGGFKI